MISVEEFKERQKEGDKNLFKGVKVRALLAIEVALKRGQTASWTKLSYEETKIFGLVSGVKEFLDEQVRPFGWKISQCYIMQGSMYQFLEIRLAEL